MIAALVIGSALPYKLLVEPTEREPDSVPEVESNGEAF